MMKKKQYIYIYKFYWLCLAVAFGSPYTLWGQLIIRDTTIIACDSLPIQLGIASQEGFSYAWEPAAFLSAADSNYTMAVFENNNPNEATYYQYSLFSYDSTEQLVEEMRFYIYVSSFSEVEIDLGIDAICRGDTLVLPLPPGISGALAINPPVAVLQNASTLLFYPNDTTSYTLTSIDSVYCGQVIYKLRVDVRSFEQAMILNEPVRFCNSGEPNDTLAIEVYPTGGIIQGPGIINSNLFSAQIAGLGMHQIVYYNYENACLTSDTLRIEVVGPASVELTGPPNLCQTDSVIELNYGIPSGGQYFIDSILTDVLNPALLPAGSHELRYLFNWDSSCVFERTKVFFIIPLPPEPILSSSDSDFIACLGDSISISTTTFPNFGWSNGLAVAMQTFTQSTDSLFVWFRSNTGCYAYSDTVTIRFTEPGLLSLTADEYNNGFEISEFGANDGSVSWNILGGLPPFSLLLSPEADSIEQNSVDKLFAGMYYFTFTDSAGCVLTDSLLLREPPQEPIEVPDADPLLPNSFTPNGDGYNDRFIISNLYPKYLQNELLVFDIRRQLVYRDRNYNNTWTGINNRGELLDEGNYFVVFLSEALSAPITQTVYILREDWD